jgi:ATP-dependent DNA helicase Rep/DNA helicase-2/ATP-dependent DNA helicase PcrA
MDFDDLLFQAVRLLEDNSEIRKHYNWRFRHILVDEYQDTNPAQFRLLRLLTEEHQNLCVVGDDDQSIYSWRGADPTHILEFSRHYPRARTITLDQNYRSTNTILDAANQVIQNNRHRYPKKLWSDRGIGEPISEFILEEDREEGEFVAEEIARRAKQQNRPWKDFAILYRSNAQSRIFEEALRRKQVPYKMVGGMSFLDRKEVKDILSYWRLILNPKDDASLRRILNWPTRGIGKGSIEALGTHAFTHEISLFEAMRAASTFAPRTAAAIARFQRLIQDLRQRLETTPNDPIALASWGRASLEAIGAKRALEEENDDPAQIARKWESVEELVHSLGQITPEVVDPLQAATPGSSHAPGGAMDTLREFLNRMTLEAQDHDDDRKDTRDENRDEVTLLTLHGAKGLEYPVVFLVGVEEGFLPHKRTIEEATDFGEERRLCYVGITRARDHLILTRAKKRIRYGKPVPRLRSRFLDEIHDGLILKRDKSFGPDENSSKQEREAHEERVKGLLANIRASILNKQGT